MKRDAKIDQVEQLLMPILDRSDLELVDIELKREAIGLARSLVAGLPQCSGRMVKVEAFNLMRGGYREHMEPVTVWEWLEHSEGGFGVQVSGRYWENRKAVRL